MPYKTIEVKPLTGSVGAEIQGVDLSKDMNQETFSEIHRAFLDHLVIFFRGQSLDVDRQIAFARRFGPLIVDPFMKSPDGRPELMVVIKDKHENRVFGENWHSDNTFLEKPPLASFLYAVEIPPYGGDTLFANQYMAYESLSPGLRKTLDPMRAVHTPASYNKSIMAGRYENRAMQLRNDEKMKEALATETEHPVIRTHPETGRKALYVNAAYTVRFKDWTEEESRPLLEHLFRQAVRSEFACRFRWQEKTLAMWDNRCVMHQAINDYQGYRRVMHRVVAEGDRPV